jgi:hypothetical protein
VRPHRGPRWPIAPPASLPARRRGAGIEPLATLAQARRPPRRAPVPSTVKLTAVGTAFSRGGDTPTIVDPTGRRLHCRRRGLQADGSEGRPPAAAPERRRPRPPAKRPHRRDDFAAAIARAEFAEARRRRARRSSPRPAIISDHGSWASRGRSIIAGQARPILAGQGPQRRRA